ncbi:LIC_13387 family protein [Larkinella soli]|uniref:LIC_13387 family protein n=1 Tax=Larkinella soli TaxID=1770527 RepID=UPI000FFC8125|nr:hypothetical protein [Larkinella soli]
MNPKLSLRLASGCALFFLAGHSIGHLTRRQIDDPAGQSVLRHMESFRFPIGGQLRTYDEFYTGMSLNLIISLAMLAVLLWLLSSLTVSQAAVVRKLLWPVMGCLFLFSVTSFLFFFPLPGISCALAVGFIGWAIRGLDDRGRQQSERFFTQPGR